MKVYQTPSVTETSLRLWDIIAASGDETNIVSTGDAQEASEIQESEWQSSWN